MMDSRNNPLCHYFYRKQRTDDRKQLQEKFASLLNVVPTLYEIFFIIVCQTMHDKQ